MTTVIERWSRWRSDHCVHMNNRALLRVDGNLITLQTLFKGPNKEFGMRNSFYSVKVHHKTLLRTGTKENFITSYLCIKKPYRAPKSTQI